MKSPQPSQPDSNLVPVSDIRSFVDTAVRMDGDNSILGPIDKLLNGVSHVTHEAAQRIFAQVNKAVQH